MTRRASLTLCASIFFGGCFIASTSAAEETTQSNPPNILFILADDLGYGDVACYNNQAKVPTPNIDRLAAEGMRFTDAHSPATVCTPSRYSLLTGQLAFRAGVVNAGATARGPGLISKDRLTLPAMLKGQGYTTAMIGKWHLGMTFYEKDKQDQTIRYARAADVRRIDFSRSIPDAPIHRGFDTFYGTVCCPTTDYLYAFVDGDRVPVPPTTLLDRNKLPRHPYANDCRIGLIAEGFDHEEIDMVFLRKSLAFLEDHAKESPKKPFFLLHSAQAVHLPSFAAEAFKGKSGVGPHGDFILEFDHIVGKLLKGLEKHGFAEKTIVIISSDNGPEVVTVKTMRADHQHDGARPWRGLKRDNWEGGHRVPMIVRWPGKVKPGSTSRQTVNLTDIMATCGAISDARIPANAAEDSFNILPVLLGTQPEDKPIREYTLQQALSGKSLRHGQWKYLDHQGSGGNKYARRGMKETGETDPDAPAQLYNLEKDPGEKINLYFKHPEIVQQMQTKLEELVKSGRSVPRLLRIDIGNIIH